MAMRALTLAALGLLLAQGDAQDDPIKQDIKRLEGYWKVVSLVDAGKRVPAEEAKQLTLLFAGNEYMVKKEDMVLRKGKYTIDPTVKPKAIDISPGQGDNKGKTMRGIYSFDNGSIRICVAPPDKDRPLDYNAGAGNGYSLYVMERDTSR
jgi:uncharacterized protein (TIGR03067 family)